MRFRRFINEVKISFMDCNKNLRWGLPPVEIWIEPTNYCNLRCKMCPQSGGLTREKGYMDFDLYKKIIDEVRGWRPIIKLFHSGESLLHPKISDMISYTKSAGCYVMMNTNATLLNEKKAEEILESGLDEISFSFDGANKETYEKIRKNAKFDVTLKNIIFFLNLKQKKKVKLPLTTVAIIKMDDTEKEIEQFFKKFDNLPVDIKRIQSLMDWTGKKDVSGNVFRGKEYSPCKAPWTYLSILWDGRVVPCCMDFNALFVLGDVRKESVMEIWNGCKNKSLRRDILNEKVKNIELCKNCHILRQKHKRRKRRLFFRTCPKLIKKILETH